MKKGIQVMLVEDNPRYRESIALALEESADIELIGEFGTSEIALRRLKAGAAPDLILLDLRLPGMDGLAAIPLFLEASADVKIMILTQSNSEADVLRAISLGASGYLLKSSTVDRTLEGIRTVMDGGASLDASVANFILNALQTRLPKEDVDGLLTARQQEVLILLCLLYTSPSPRDS